uniref:Ovule protein n=1 Tax=Heterorhabditis bacteriophora TaxID=37862 RepID=A0A1I7WF60_HETBA
MWSLLYSFSVFDELLLLVSCSIKSYQRAVIANVEFWEELQPKNNGFMYLLCLKCFFSLISFLNSKRDTSGGSNLLLLT